VDPSTIHRDRSLRGSAERFGHYWFDEKKNNDNLTYFIFLMEKLKKRNIKNER
jgi:hypothetical protein